MFRLGQITPGSDALFTDNLKHYGHKDWILNSSLLLKEQVKFEVTDTIKALFNDSGVSPQLTWDAFKAVLRRKFILLSSFYKKEREYVRLQILDRIAALEQAHKHTSSKKIHKQLLKE